MRRPHFPDGLGNVRTYLSAEVAARALLDDLASNDAVWSDAWRTEEVTTAAELSALLFWKGLLLGLLLSTTAWLVLAAAVFSVYRVLAQ